MIVLIRLTLALFALLLTLASISPSGAQASAAKSANAQPSFERRINTDWKFTRAEGTELPPVEPPSDTDPAWQTVCLPHTPRVEKFDETHPWQGICWYRKTLLPDPAWKGKCVSVQFGAAMQIADVWVNGQHRTRHLGGYLPFSVDLTNEAQRDTPIGLLVQLDNRDTDQTPPGKPTDGLDFNYPGGLYRGVKLIVTDPLHVSDPITANSVAGGGVFVTYSDVSQITATVHVRTDITYEGEGLARNCVVRQTLIGSDGGASASSVSEPALVPAGGHHEFVQAFIVNGPQLWSPDRPYLYTLETTVLRDGKPMDCVRTRIGIRTFALGKRVLINGVETHLAGSNRHQEHPYIEYALSPNAGWRDARRIKEAGLNQIRLSHYPQDPAFLDACDALGILVQSPIPGWQEFRDNASFVESSYQNIRDLIRRDRNHPCILFWEPNLNETDRHQQDWCRTAYEIAHEEYPGDQCFTFGDPYPSGWKPGWDVRHFIREYGDFGFGGNESTSRHTRGEGEAALLQQAWNFQWCHNQSWAQWADLNSSFYGDATWCMFDYNRGYYPKPCSCGMMDIFRLPKYVYYFFQSQRDPKNTRPDSDSGPMVFLATDWSKRAATTKVVVFSNCDEVALRVNGKLFKRQKPDAGPDTKYSDWNADIAATTGSHYDNTGGHPFDGGNAKHLDHPPFTFFAIPYAPGTVQAVGYLGGAEVAAQTVQTPGKPAALHLSFDLQRVPLAADGADCVFVRAEIRDAHGTTIPLNSLPSLKFSVSGPGHLIGTDPVHAEAGVASVLLQATDSAGPITVTARADGLKAVTETIVSTPPPGDVSRTAASL